MSKIWKKVLVLERKKKSAQIPIPILLADTIADTEFRSHTMTMMIKTNHLSMLQTQCAACNYWMHGGPESIQVVQFWSYRLYNDLYRAVPLFMLFCFLIVWIAVQWIFNLSTFNLRKFFTVPKILVHKKFDLRKITRNPFLNVRRKNQAFWGKKGNFWQKMLKLK